jgi:uncharacterized protein involved in exopolysaccharide biosynthesis
MVAREAESQSSGTNYRRLLRKHRWLMTGIFLLTVLTVAIWTFVQVPIYQAVATILIEPEPPKVLNIQDVVPMGGASDRNFYPTQYEIMKSRPVLERAAAALKARTQLAARSDGTDGVADELSAAITIEPKRNTRLVLIKIDGPDPARAAEAANALANAYAKYNVELKLKGARDALSWLTEEAGRLRAKAEESSQALQNYRVRTGILGMQEQRQITAAKIMDFNKAFLEAQAQRLSLESKLQELNRIAKEPAGVQTIFTVADNALIDRLKGEASTLETERSKLLKVYKEKHPEILKIDAQIQQVKQRLEAEFQNTLQAVQTQYKVAKAREDTLANQVNQLRQEGQQLNEKEIQYQNLQREVESNQALYESVLKRMKETGVAGGLEDSNVRIIEAAAPPTVPIRPRKARNVALSIAAGLALAFGAAFALEYLDTTVKTPDDVERYLGLSVIGVVPAFHAKRR